MPSLSHLSQSDRSLAIVVCTLSDLVLVFTFRKLGLVAVYEAVVVQFNADQLAEKLLPSLLPLAVDPMINLDHV